MAFTAILRLKADFFPFKLKETILQLTVFSRLKAHVNFYTYIIFFIPLTG